MTLARHASWRRRAGWPLVWAAAVAAQAWLWAAARPKVRATSDDGVGAYAQRSHLSVFGADATFMLVTGAFALLAAVLTVAMRRGRPLTPLQVLLSTLATVVTAAAVMLVAPLLDAVSRGAGQPFPPARLPRAHRRRGQQRREPHQSADQQRAVGVQPGGLDGRGTSREPR